MKMNASIVIPAHNEEKNLEKCVESVYRECGKLGCEIIIVDDCSSDETGKIADKLAGKNSNISVIHRSPPNGFGLAVRDGFKKAKGNVILPVMADLSDDPKTIPKMIKKVGEGYDIVIGSRFVKGGKTVEYPFIKLFCNRLYNNVLALVFGKNIKDFSNAFKAYRKEVFKGIRLKSTCFELTAEMILKPMVLRNAKIAEVPTTWKNRKAGEAKMKLLDIGGKYGSILLECFALRFRGQRK